MPKPLRERLAGGEVLAWAWSADRLGMSCLVLVVVTSAAAQAGLMIMGGAIVSALTMGSSPLPSVVAFGVIGALIAVLAWMRTVMAARVSRAYLRRTLVTLVDAALAPATVAHVEDAGLRGELGVASESLRENVHLRVIPAVVDLWAARLAGVASAVVLVGFHWWAPLVMAAGYVGLMWGYRRWLSGIFDDLAESTGEDRRRAEYYRSLMAEPAAAKEVRLFALAPWLDGRFGRTWMTAMGVVWRHRARGVMPVMIGGLILMVALAVVTGVLGYQAMSGAVSAAMVTVAIQAIAGMDSLSYQGESAWHLSRGRRELLTIRGLAAALDPQEAPAPSAQPLEHGSSSGPHAVSITIEELSFRYAGSSELILDGLSVDVPAGQSIGIVGANGAGKSTLMKLLAGLYRPTGGSILIDNEPADAASSKVAAIFQSFGRCDLSLAENVVLGDSRDSDPIRDALQRAGAGDLLERLDLDTVLSASYRGGTDLSGGQWQKVALARALLHAHSGAGLLILDEPTAALDIRAEAELFARFIDLTKDVTSVLVSHRLSSVRQVDRILVLSEGRIIEDGDHDALMQLNGEYAAMFRLQAERFRTDLVTAVEAENA